ncbi:unnamed protein product [Oppiella nova]|uniref:G-protein coupled receptors family 1 profile domain-containing protein n=1 Tax=Oppiella nova TaxID=334625 RepID=A0A7R9M2R1_9ACAR|nr:unnamed protein product [Oppiella nova]CAG2169548.1 unnamed protein product [Oppiella nova]
MNSTHYLTIIGNVLIITSIITTPKLCIRPNYLILSLSITDLLIGVFSMPVTAYYGIVYVSDWIMGSIICDIHYFMAGVCTTSSFLHLMCIAIDRYLSVTRIQYSRNKSLTHIKTMISFSWTFSILVTC